MNEELQKAIAEFLVDYVGLDVIRDALVGLAWEGGELADTWEKAIDILDGEEDTPTPLQGTITSK